MNRPYGLSLQGLSGFGGFCFYGDLKDNFTKFTLNYFIYPKTNNQETK